MRFISIPADESVAMSVLDTDDYPSVYEAFTSVVGGLLEAVSFVAAGHTLYVDEEGKLKGLPLNARATSMTRGVLSPWDFVHGDTVLVGPLNASGDDTEVAAEAPARLGLAV